MRGRTINKVTGRRMHSLIARIKLHMHYIPAFELNIADLPLLSFGVTAKHKAALLRSYENHYLFAHRVMLLSYRTYSRLESNLIPDKNCTLQDLQFLRVRYSSENRKNVLNILP